MNDVYRPLAETRRGREAHFPFQETLHHGAISVVAGDGRPVASVGDSHTALPLRSTAKPFQLLPLLLDDIGSRFAHLKRPLDDKDMALMMSSHNGEPMHVERVASLLEGAGLTASNLLCGVQEPLHEPSRRALQQHGETPSALH